jgi:cell division protease FtsH
LNGKIPEISRRRTDGRQAARKPKGFLLVAVLLSGLVLVALLFQPGVIDHSVETNFDVVVHLLHQDRLDPGSLEYVVQEHLFRGKILPPSGAAPPGGPGAKAAAGSAGPAAAVEKGPTHFELLLGGGEMDKTFFDEFRRYNDRHQDDPSKMIWPRQVPSHATVLNNLFTLLPWVVFTVIIYFVFIRQLRAGGPGGGSVLSFGKSRARLATKESTGVTFSDVAGIEEAKGEVREVIEFLRNPARFQKLGGRIPRGILLVGSPGTGKTLLARAIAGEAGVPFFSICGSDFVEMFVGVGASRVRDLFKQARDSAPCIVFLDEVDAVGRRRGSGFTGGHDEREQTLNAILVEMDGFNSDEGIIVIASTNRPDVLDPALLRPGRFDREIVIDLPDLKGREEILRVHTRKVKLDPLADLHRVARGTATFSGAELAALVNEAAIIAAMNDQTAVGQRDLEEARDKIRWGRQKTSRVMSEEDRRITAYHEAGHALVAHLLPGAEPLHKVTIIPRGMALGATLQLPERDRYHLARKQVLANLTVLFAGRAAEEVACGDITAGARNDIERATHLARMMVCEWGMSEAVGPIDYAGRGEPATGPEGARRPEYSESVAARIDQEIRRIIDDSYQRAQKLVRKHREELERITQALLAKETLTGEEVKVIFNGGEIELPLLRLHGPAAPAPKAAAAESTGVMADGALEQGS